MGPMNIEDQKLDSSVRSTVCFVVQWSKGQKATLQWWQLRIMNPEKNKKVLDGVEEELIFSCGRGLLFDYDYD